MITDKSIRATISGVKAGGRRWAELKDEGERGAGRLSIIIRAGTTKPSAEWYVQWYREAKRHLVKLGSYPTITLAQARKLYRDHYAPAILKGQSPTGPRSWVNHRGATVADLFTAYVDRLEGAGKPGGYHARRLLLGPNGAVHALGGARPPGDIKPSDIRPFLQSIHRRGTITEANSAHAYIRAAFNFAIKHGNSYHETAGGIDWGLETNPASLIPVNHDAFRPRDRTLDVAEFRIFYEWLLAKDGLIRRRFAPALRLMMVTGQRPGEILQLSVDHYDRAHHQLFWPKTKNGRQHCIPLPRQAVEILDNLKPNEHGLYFPRLFSPELWSPTYVGGALIRYYIRQSGAAPFTMRDFRRSWKTEAGAAGAPKDIRDRIQNHALMDVSSRHYDRWSYMNEKRAAMVSWEGHLDLILSGEMERRAEKAA